MVNPLEGLDPEQAEVVAALAGPVLVLAGAGTGKTRAITARLAHACLIGARDPRRALVVTFTTRAAGELRDRVARLGVPGVAARTIHAAALRQVRHFWPRVIGGEFPQLVVSKTALVARVAGELSMPTGANLVRDLTAEVDWAGASLLLPAQYAEQALATGRQLPGQSGDRIAPGDVASLIAAYQSRKEREHLIDLDDVLLILIAMMGDRPDVADEIRAAYRWFTVDEYQDVSPLQEQLIRAWVGERDDICVVGDPNQTIYTFAGASQQAMSRFQQHWPHATQVILDRCYRCSPQVVASANALNRAARGPVGNSVTLRSQCADGPTPQVVMCADEAQEAAMVAQRIAALIGTGTAAREIAVLSRTNIGLQAIQEALEAAAIPYVTGGLDRFFARDAVREAAVRLRGAAKTRSGGGQLMLGDLPSAVAEVLAGMGWTPAGPVDGPAGRQRWESLAALAALAEEVGQDSAAGLADFVAELERRGELGLAPVANAVAVTTLHAAKGLEWDAVHIVGCVEGAIPIAHATTEAQLDEERRLLYVGMTRARRVLTLSWSLTREPNGRHRDPSRFLAQLRATSPASAGRGSGRGVSPVAGVATRPAGPPAGQAGGRGPLGRPGRCRICGRALVTAPERTIRRCRSCPGGPDPALLESLRSWRSATAVAAGVPASMLLTEATMAAVAEIRPVDVTALAAIPGLTAEKLDRFGPELLALVAASCVPGPGPATGQGASVPSGQPDVLQLP